MRAKRFAFGVMIITLTLVCGCSGKSTIAAAKVEGSISYKGKPVPDGTMTFWAADGTAYGAVVSRDGTYSATDIPEGEAVITIDTETLKPAASGQGSKHDAMYNKMKNGGRPAAEGAPLPPSKEELYVKLPAKYAKKATSPLTITLKSGRQVHNIELTD